MLAILCVDSVPQRLAQIKQDLVPLSVRFHIITATNCHKAEQLLLQNTHNIALISSALINLAMVKPLLL